MKHPWLDANEIAPGLWQGSLPVRGLVLKTSGFQTLVICAQELESAVEGYPGVRVHFAPNHDDGVTPFTPEAYKVAYEAAELVVADIQAGRRVLVSCMAGLNRSGLVSALALHLLYGWPGARCVDHVRSKRRPRGSHQRALSNDAFVEALYELRPRQQATSSDWEESGTGLLIPRK